MEMMFGGKYSESLLLPSLLNVSDRPEDYNMSFDTNESDLNNSNNTCLDKIPFVWSRHVKANKDRLLSSKSYSNVEDMFT